MIRVTPENFPHMPHMLSGETACWFFNVIILDSLNISMHTYALPNAMLPCAVLSPCWFYRSACAFKRTLQCHKRNNSGYNPSAMTEEVLGCPLNIEMMTKSVANILGIYFKCRKGRGPYLFCCSSPRRSASLRIYVRFLTLCQIFLPIVHKQTISSLWALFSCKYCQGPTHWRFLINFWNKYIGSAVTHIRPASRYSPFILTFYSYLSCVDLDRNCRVWCGRR